LGIRFLYQKRTDLGSNLFAKVSFEERTGCLSRTKSFDAGTVLEGTVRFLDFFPHSLWRNFKNELLLYRTERFNGNFHKRHKKVTAKKRTGGRSKRNALSAVRERNPRREGGLDPPSAVKRARS